MHFLLFLSLEGTLYLSISACLSTRQILTGGIIVYFQVKQLVVWSSQVLIFKNTKVTYLVLITLGYIGSL